MTLVSLENVQKCVLGGRVFEKISNSAGPFRTAALFENFSKNVGFEANSSALSHKNEETKIVKITHSAMLVKEIPFD